MKQTQKPQKGVLSVFGKTLPDKASSLPREVIKWIQSLDLTYSIKNVKKDFNNGFLVAQILSRYYPVTNDQMNNYKAIQMHQIDNGFSMKSRKDNWEQIQKFLSKIPDITTKIEDLDRFILNKNGEILVFIISLYQELTKRHVPMLDGKIITTDIDNINKSYLLKENGEIERLKKSDVENLSGVAQTLNVNNNNNTVTASNQDQQQASIDNKKTDLVDQFQKSQKTNNSILTNKTGNVVMKGDVKPMSSQPAQMEKGFKVKIGEPKVYEPKGMQVLKQAKEIDINAINRGVIPTQKNDEGLVYNPLSQNDRDIEAKVNNTDNPFLSLGEDLRNKILSEFPEDYKKIYPIEDPFEKFKELQAQMQGIQGMTPNGTNSKNEVFDENHRRIYMPKFIDDFFKNIDVLSEKVIEWTINIIITIIENFYNILSGKQCNDYIDTFLLLYNTYINYDEADENSRKPAILHDGIKMFMMKSLKNKNEEMLFIFKQIFIEKIFETINDPEYNTKISYLCDLLYSILEPNNDQQIQLFKMFKEKVKSDEVLYECFAILHDKLDKYTDGLIDGCLFYVLNGLTSENPKVRYFSLYILLKYASMSVNFVNNLSTTLSRLAYKETDRENCLLIIKIVSQTLKAAYMKKIQPKENKKGPNGNSGSNLNNNNVNSNNNLNSNTNVNVNVNVNNNSENLNAFDKMPIVSDEDQQIYLNEIAYANKIINNIVSRFSGDNLFILLFTFVIYDYLFDNTELYKTLLIALFNSNDSLHKFVFYENEDLDENMQLKYGVAILRNPVNIDKIINWNKPMLFKAFDLILSENNITQLTEKDYKFIEFLTKTDLDPAYSEVWKSSFNFYHLIIKDLSNVKTVYGCLEILSSFLNCESIQKFVFDEWYDNLKNTFDEIINENAGNLENEQAKQCEKACYEYLDMWNNNTKISQIVRDDVRKLMEIFPKQPPKQPVE